MSAPRFRQVNAEFAATRPCTERGTSPEEGAMATFRAETPTVGDIHA
jgi:hypothetical protein